MSFTRSKNNNKNNHKRYNFFHKNKYIIKFNKNNRLQKKSALILYIYSNMHFENLSTDWQDFFKPEFEKPYFFKLNEHINNAYQTTTVYPPKHLIFNAFNLCSINHIKVILIGQDPYHNYGQAHGLSFSVNEGIKLPPSLRNIFKELKNDIPNFNIPMSGNLEYWAQQGVLLLNSILTVQHNLPGSHKNFGWQPFTDSVIHGLSQQKSNLVFLLWGNFAISKSKLIDQSKHLVLTSAHPSPLARGAFFGSQHFSKTNNYLIINGIPPINWSL